MKKTLAYVSVILFAFSCQPTDNTAVEQKNAEIDSLKTVIEEGKEDMNEFFSALSEIESNLEEIKRKEKLLQVKSNDGSQDLKDKINNDVMAIYELLKENQAKLAQIQDRNKRSSLKIVELNNVISQLQDRLTEKNTEIAGLKSKLVGMDLLVDSLFSGLDSMLLNMAIKDEIIEFQSAELSKAFYVVGTKKELIEKEVLTKQGLFAGLSKIKQLKTDFNKDYFTQININELKAIPLFAENAEVVTNHPSEAFEMIKSEQFDSLKIIDAQNFWSVSKFCVIVLE